MSIIEVQLVEAADGSPSCFYYDEEELRRDSNAAFNAIKENCSHAFSGKTVIKMTYKDDEDDDCTLAAASVSDALEFCGFNNDVKVLKLKVETAPDMHLSPDVTDLSGTYTYKFEDGESTGTMVLAQEGCDGATVPHEWTYTVSGLQATIHGHGVTGTVVKKGDEVEKIVWSNGFTYTKVVPEVEKQPAEGQAQAFTPPARVEEASTWAPAPATVTRLAAKGNELKVEPKEMKEDVVAWCDRDYTYQNIPSEMVGATLYSSLHKPAGGGHFAVDAPAGAEVYIFCEAHRDGGFPSLGWKKVDIERFQWFCPKKKRAYGLTAWRHVHTGSVLEIPVPECLVGGVAVQVKPSAPASQGCVWDANKVIEILRCMTAGLDIRKVLPKLAEKCLAIINETQIPELFPLLDPLVSLVEGSLDLEQIKAHLGAGEAFWALPKEMKSEIAVRVQSALMAVIEELRHEPSTVEVHMNVVCDGCEQSPIIGKRFKCNIRPDYDLCEHCHARVHETDEHADFTQVKSNTHADVVGFVDKCCPCVVCDGCDKPITSPQDRHKCAVCADYDLCSDCFTQRAAIHHHDSWVQPSDVPSTQNGDTFCVPAACVPPGEAPPPDAEPETQAEEGRERFHSYMGDDELSPAIAARALASLLYHPDESIRCAARQAIGQAIEGAETDSEGSPPTSEQGDTEGTALPSDQDETEDTQPPSDTDWEKPALEETVYPESAKVLGAHFSTPSQAVFDMAEARGDVSEQSAHLLEQYPNVSQAFMLGHLAIFHGEQDASALGKVIVKNDGGVPWPEVCSLRLVAGPAYAFPALQLGAVPTGDSVELVLDLKFGRGEQGDTALSCWAMIDEQGQPFGPLMLLQVSRI